MILMLSLKPHQYYLEEKKNISPLAFHSNSISIKKKSLEDWNVWTLPFETFAYPRCHHYQGSFWENLLYEPEKNQR